MAGPKKEAAIQEYQQQIEREKASADITPATAAPLQETMSRPESTGTPLALQDAGQVKINTPELEGSISLRGARFDNLSLKHHKTEKGPNGENIQLLVPYGSEHAYFVNFNWFAQQADNAPTAETAWSADADTLTPEKPVTLSWDNGAGMRYMIQVAVDEKFMFTVTQSVLNSSDHTITVAPYGYIRRSGKPETAGLYILHEGLIGVFDGILEEKKYKDLKEDGDFEKPTTGGWFGITDKFWMTTLVPDSKTPLLRARLSHSDAGGQEAYGADYMQNWQIIQPGGTLETTNRFYAGAKIVETIDKYEEQYNITLFNRAIDWGWFWFLTQPIFKGLHLLFKLTGNYGIAILLMTVILKLILFPLANKSYVSMSHMKKAQPKIKALQERYKDDKQRMQQEMMALYKKEKINPMAGCLPMIPQMFIFFALYKTLYVTIEMRHQPFFGWIQDLSAPDHLTPLNLFGLIPWDPPTMIAVGILPILMGISMWLQQKLNPQTSMDPAQQKIMSMLPIIFTFVMAGFSSGLVLYWTWNNILSITQQWVIMRREEARNK